MKRTNKIFLASIVLTAIIFFNSAYLNKNNSNFSPGEFKYSISPLAAFDFKKLKDTVYTNKDYYIEVNLNTQHGILYSRDGSEYIFPVSTGNKRVEDGMETNQGLFAIQWMAKKQHSVQFDSTLMLNWMGFNNGIGFHALLGKSYYKYLGKKNVSHGCVRLSREDAQFIYEKIEKGTPVLVHKGNNVVKIAFTSEGESYNQYSYSETFKLLKERYQILYDGDYLISSNEKILIDEKNVYHGGLPIGNSELLPSKQNLKPETLWVENTLPETDKLIKILKGQEKTDLTLNQFLDSRN